MTITNTKVVDTTSKYIVQSKGIGNEEDQIVVDAEKLTSGNNESKVNLIEYNAIGDNQFLQAKQASISQYISALEGQNISVTVRQSRGNDIDAACGQLANKQH